MVDVSTDILINAPLIRVSSFASDPDNAPLWYENIKTVKWTSAKPLQKNSEIEFTAQFMGKRLEYTYKVVQYEPEKILVMQTSQGPFPMKTIYTWENMPGNSTRMVLRNTGSPSGFSKILAPLMSFMMRRANNKDLRKLKSILEKS